MVCHPVNLLEGQFCAGADMEHVPMAEKKALPPIQGYKYLIHFREGGKKSEDKVCHMHCTHETMDLLQPLLL